MGLRLALSKSLGSPGSNLWSDTPHHRAALLQNTPIWCFHGGEDRDVPVEGSRRAVQMLLEGGRPVRYTEMPGVGHNCAREVFGRDDLLPWLFEQSRK